MQFQVQSPDGEVLYTQTQLQHALAQQSARRVLPAWMQSLVWPAGMVRAMRDARRCNLRSALRAILLEARMLFDAEHAGLTTAAAAIRTNCARSTAIPRRFATQPPQTVWAIGPTAPRRWSLIDGRMTADRMMLDTHAVRGVNRAIRSPRTGPT